MSFLRTISKLVKGAVTTGLALVATLALFLHLPVINQIAEGQDTVYDIDEIETEFKEEVEEVVEEEDEPEDEARSKRSPSWSWSPSGLSLAHEPDDGRRRGPRGRVSAGAARHAVAHRSAAATSTTRGRRRPRQRPPCPSIQVPNLTATQQKHTPGRVVLI